jgi:hypothetical protein
MIKVIELEKKLLDPKVRKSKRELEQLFSDDFLEFGKSGKVYDKKQVITGLLNETFDIKYTPTNFNGQTLSPSVIHLTYDLEEDNGLVKTHSLRTSIWIKKDEKWEINFHQGTKKE